MKTRSLVAGVAVGALFVLAAAQEPARAQTAAPAPDIWVSRIDMRKPSYSPGERFTITVTIENRGTAVAPGSTHNGYMVDISLALHPAGFPAVSHTLPAPYRFVEDMLLKGGRISRTDDLAPGESRQYSASVELPKPMKAGKYWVGFTADPFNRLNETQPYPRGENDNGGNVDIQIVELAPLAPIGAKAPAKPPAAK
jgi:hypothetical protein